MLRTIGDVVLVLDSRRTYGVGEIASWPEFRQTPIVTPIPEIVAPQRRLEPLDFPNRFTPNNRASRRRAAAQKRRKA